MIYIRDIYPIYIRYFQLKISYIFDIFNKLAYCIVVKACNCIFYVHSNVYAYWVPSYIEADPKLAIPDLQHRSSKQCCGSGIVKLDLLLTIKITTLNYFTKHS